MGFHRIIENQSMGFHSIIKNPSMGFHWIIGNPSKKFYCVIKAIIIGHKKDKNKSKKLQLVDDESNYSLIREPTALYNMLLHKILFHCSNSSVKVINQLTIIYNIIVNRF